MPKSMDEQVKVQMKRGAGGIQLCFVIHDAMVIKIKVSLPGIEKKNTEFFQQIEFSCIYASSSSHQPCACCLDPYGSKISREAW